MDKMENSDQIEVIYKKGLLLFARIIAQELIRDDHRNQNCVLLYSHKKIKLEVDR